MGQYINEHGKPVYIGVTAETEFSSELFHKPECQGIEGNESFAFHSEMGSLTVLKRMTGYGYRDVETGYRSPDDRFWLASGGCDVRRVGCKTVGEAIEWVKARANICMGD